MEQETQIRLTKDVFAHLAAGTTDRAPAVSRNPVTAYASADRLRRERQVLFRDYPLLMGLSCQLAEPGAYLTDDLSGVPLLVVRGADGGVHAFYNVCRHRGSKVVSGCGTAGRNFVCPYHAWTYDFAGNLVGVPDSGSFDDLDRAGHGLVPLPVAEQDGLIWVKPTPGPAIDLGAHLGGLSPEFASYGFADYHHYETRVLRQAMNWKIAIDTFLEPYHFAALHRNTVGPIFIPNLCLFEPFGKNLRETLPRRSITELKDQPETDWDLVKHTAIVYVLFPNTVFVMQADHAETWRVFPVGDKPDECVMYLDFYIPEPADSDGARRHWERSMDLTIRTVAEEDFPTGESIQFGFRAGAQDHVTYGRNEPALAHFQAEIAKALGEGG